jgi:glycosyltransferase involved in cell wall biosynthesis
MKVLYDHQVFCIQRFGGVSRYFVELARELQGRPGVVPSIAALAHVNGYLRATDPLHWASFRADFPRRGLRWRPRLLAPAFNAVVRMSRAGIVHETHYSLGAHRLPRHVKVVTTVHDMIFEKYPHWVPEAAQRAALKRMTIERADQIICISHHTRRDLLDVYPQVEGKTTVVHHGVAPAVGEVRCEGGEGSKRPYLLYVGIRGGHKNFEGLIRAFGASPRLRHDFDILCFGGEPFTADDTRMLVAHGIDLHRVVQRFGDDAALAAAYRGAELFVFPSSYEGFGMPLTEAMAQDCPIACSRASCFPEICGPAAEYFDPADVDSIVTALETVVGSPERRQQLRVAGRHRVADFSWRRCGDETLAVYARLH